MMASASLVPLAVMLVGRPSVVGLGLAESEMLSPGGAACAPDASASSVTSKHKLGNIRLVRGIRPVCGICRVAFAFAMRLARRRARARGVRRPDSPENLDAIICLHGFRAPYGAPLGRRPGWRLYREGSSQTSPRTSDAVAFGQLLEPGTITQAEFDAIKAKALS
jgi:hypothetical protein